MTTPTETIRSKVYNFILRSGAAGLTDEEIANSLGIPGDIVRPRRNELVQTGQVSAATFRRPTARGRTAKVWLSSKVLKKLETVSKKKSRR